MYPTVGREFYRRIAGGQQPECVALAQKMGQKASAARAIAFDGGAGCMVGEPNLLFTKMKTA